MANYQLTPISPGQSAIHRFDGLCIREITSNSIFSCAVDSKHTRDVSAVLNSTLQLTWPTIGQCTTANKALCLGLQIDQCFVILENDHTNANEAVSTLKEIAALTDQSDGWVTIEISGLRSRDVLERICPINLETNHFPSHTVARTSMEHLSVIIIRLDEDFLMLSPRSSADSFLHSVVQSAEYVI